MYAVYDKISMLQRKIDYLIDENARLRRFLDAALEENKELRMEVKIWRGRERFYNDLINKRLHRYTIYY